MTIRSYDVALDSRNEIQPEPVFGRQGDKTGAVVIKATLSDNGSPISLSGQKLIFMATTADERAIIADSNGFEIISSDRGSFNFKVPNALWAVAGKIKNAYFSLSDSDGMQSTFSLRFVVLPAVDLSQQQAKDYITVIDGTIRDLSSQVADIQGKINMVLAAYTKGDFYNKSETDSKDASVLSSANKYTDDKTILATSQNNGLLSMSDKQKIDALVLTDYYKKTDIDTLIASSSNQEIKGVNGAASSAWLTVYKAARICVLVIYSKLPKKTGTMYWIPQDYTNATNKIGLIRCGSQATLSVNGFGNVELLSNTSDAEDAIGFTVWGY